MSETRSQRPHKTHPFYFPKPLVSSLNKPEVTEKWHSAPLKLGSGPRADSGSFVIWFWQFFYPFSEKQMILVFFLPSSFVCRCVLCVRCSEMWQQQVEQWSGVEGKASMETKHYSMLNDWEWQRAAGWLGQSWRDGGMSLKWNHFLFLIKRWQAWDSEVPSAYHSRSCSSYEGAIWWDNITLRGYQPGQGSLRLMPTGSTSGLCIHHKESIKDKKSFHANHCLYHMWPTSVTESKEYSLLDWQVKWGL